MSKTQSGENVKTLEKQQIEYEYPSMYNVILLNDDITTMDFVVQILIEVFYHNRVTAEKITQQIHKNGEGICGTYSKDIALSKVVLTRKYSKQAKYPLKCVARKAIS
jgi:ATP-dependent Clp protease adaptor protein ClpS